MGILVVSVRERGNHRLPLDGSVSQIYVYVPIITCWTQREGYIFTTTHIYILLFFRELFAITRVCAVFYIYMQMVYEDMSPTNVYGCFLGFWCCFCVV